MPTDTVGKVFIKDRSNNDFNNGLEDINMETKQMIYDELCAVLTRYEESDDDESELLYEMLVKIQNRWEDVITAERK